MGRHRHASRGPVPPRLARLLLHLLPASAREFVVGDLEEEYRERQLRQRGRFVADVWFWRQAIASLFAFRGFRPSKHSAREPHRGAGGSGGGFRSETGGGRTGTSRLDSLLHDLRLASRSLIRRPGFTAVAVLTLGLGIGTATAMFAAIDAAFFQPLPFGDPDRLLRVWMANRETGVTANPFTIRDFHDWREAATVADLAVYGGTGLNVSTGETTEWSIGILASTNLLSVLGIEPRLGRGFTPEEERPGAPRTVMLTSDFWEQDYGSDPEALGRTLTLDGEPYTIVGVLPSNVTLPYYRADLWLPLHVRGDEPRTGHSFWGLARYPKDASREQAVADLQAAARSTAAMDPGQIFPDVTVASYAESVNGPEAVPISIAFGAAVLFVLLIACANIANLLLARGIDRAHEIAVRNALGGGRRRVLGQLLTEAFLVALLGGAAGVALAYAGIELLRLYIVPPGDLELALDHRVLLTCLVLTVASALLSGFVPALVSSRVDLRSRLQAGTRGVLGSGRRRLGQALVVAQVTMVLALLVSAGLITRSLVVLSRVELGFRTQGLMTFQVSPPASRYPDAEALKRFFIELRERVVAIPGVTAVALTDNSAVGYGSTALFTIPERNEGEDYGHRSAQVRVVDEGFQQVMGLGLVAGRWFQPALDSSEGPATSVVSRTLAEAVWGNPQAALGKMLEAYDNTTQVVGVVESGRMVGPDQSPPLVIYLPFQQHSRRSISYVVDADLDPAAIFPQFRRALAEMDGALALHGAGTLQGQLEEYLENYHISLRLFFVFAGLALVLTLVGVFGVVSHQVSRSSREMGLRLALGADRRLLVRHVLYRSGRTAAAGLVLGVLVSLAFGKVLGSVFFGIEPLQPVILLTALCFTAMAILGAIYVPARRAARVDPVKTLNAD